MFGHDKQDDTSQTTVPVATDDYSQQAPQDELTLPTMADETQVQDMPAEDYISTPIGMPLPSTTPEIPSSNLVPDAALSSTTIGINSSGTLSNLSALKQDALRELSPLISLLDQTPEEKYTTAKMIFQETKDQNILSAVYEAAKNLPDEKARANAIWEVVKLTEENN